MPPPNSKTNPTKSTPVSPIVAGLLDHRVIADIKDLDHYRIHGGMAVETDYIVYVSCEGAGEKKRSEPDFDSFQMSKTFSAFRTLADQLQDAADAVMNQPNSAALPRKVRALANYCNTVLRLVDSQRTEYLGKVNYMYVKTLAKQRKQILSEVLDATLTSFPDEIDSHPFLATVSQKIEAFFLTDHCESDAACETLKEKSNSTTRLFTTPLKIVTPMVTPMKKQYHNVENKVSAKQLSASVTSPVVPFTRKVRRSSKTRELDEADLNQTGGSASLLLDNDRSQKDLVPSYEAPISATSLGSSYLGTLIDNNPIMFSGIFVAALQFLKYVSGMVVTVDLDILLLVAFASFCVGLHTPRPMVHGVDQPPLKQTARRKRAGAPSTPRNAAKLLRRSMVAMSPRPSGGFSAQDLMLEEEEEEDDICIRSPMPRFPEGAPLGSMVGCWSDPPHEVFRVRGDNYLTDRKKVPSGSYLFPGRGIDLFLTDACPENVGRNSSIMGGELRDLPTFIINFRLPWGVLLFYYEIPERFLPFIKGCYNDPSVKRADLEAKIKSMNNQDRCCARFLLGDHEHKDQTLKLFPSVVEGPWVAKSVVGGKPAIIGTKLPVSYVYEPESEGKDGKKQALYLEADLDIVSSSAARGILSVVRTYTQDLTIDLGFGIQGNSPDELREQMLTGTRIHGLDPLNAPALPPMKDMLFTANVDSADDDDNTERSD